MEGLEDIKSRNEPPTCFKCEKRIYDGTIFSVAERYWHNSCLRCIVCRTKLTGCCHVKGTDIYCRTDFARLFGAKCSGCQKLISPHENVRVAGDGVYHVACFACITCSNVIPTGSDVYTRDDGKLVCSEDYKNLIDNDGFPSSSDADKSDSDDAATGYQDNISDTQLRMLTTVYYSNKRPARHVRQKVSRDTGLSLRAVQTWFRNERRKDRINGRARDSVIAVGQLTVAERQSYSGHGILHNDVNIWTMTSFNCQPPSVNANGEFNDVCMGSAYQLYCPLDYLIPDEMPPNVELSAADICNGEVISGKYRYENRKLPMFSEPSRGSLMPENTRQWISV